MTGGCGGIAGMARSGSSKQRHRRVITMQQMERSRARSSRGMALVSTMFLLMILSGIAAAMVTSGQTEMMVARNSVSSAQAEAAAEAGLNHATELVIPFATQFAANGFANIGGAMTGLIQGPDGLTGNLASDADNGSLENLGIPRPPAQVALVGAFGVSYEARVFDEDDPARGVTLSAADLARIGEDGDPTTDANSTVVIQAIGYALDNTRVTFETIIGDSAAAVPALVAGGDVSISGNATFTGTLGGVHANDDLDISGNPDIAQDATAGGTFTASGSPTVGGMSGGGEPEMSIPPVAAIDYKPLADFILNSTGQMTDQLGTVICDASASNDACAVMGYGWEYNPPGWKISGNDGGIGTYYVEGPATISGNVGDPATPLAMTIIATDSIEISGNPFLTPDTPGLLFVTDGDLKINGNAGAGELNYEGAMLVHEQLQVSGNAKLTGQIIVEDGADNSSLVTQTQISGNATFTYNGGNTWGSITTLTMNAWREVR